MRAMVSQPLHNLTKNQPSKRVRMGRVRFWIQYHRSQVLNNVNRKLQIKNLMKRMLLSLVMAAVCSGLFAQSVEKAKDLLKANKFVEAKDEIDKSLLLEKYSKNAEAWYTKVKIYDT